MPFDLKELNIELASSDSAIKRTAGMVVRAVRRMPVDFLPDYLVDRQKFNHLLKQEDGEAERRKNLRNSEKS